MSRLRQSEIPRDNMFSHDNIIDFKSNAVASPSMAAAAAAAPGIVGGPHAFLEMNGIRYVPETAQTLAAAAEPTDFAPRGNFAPLQRRRSENLDSRISQYLRANSAPRLDHAKIRRQQQATENMLSALEDHIETRSLRAKPAPLSSRFRHTPVDDLTDW